VLWIVTIYLVVPLLRVVAFLQTTLVPHVAIWGVFADLPLVVVVSWSLLRGPREGILWGFVAGVMVDLFSGAPFGASTLALIAVGLLAGLGAATVFRAQIALPLLAMFLATIVYDLLFLLIVGISGYPVAWLESLYRLILPSAALNAVLTPVVLVAMRWLHTRFGREDMEW
jgi:rod shape-determining protein MreD